MFPTPDLLYYGSAKKNVCVVDIDMCEIKKVHSEHILLHFSREDLCNIFHIVVVII